MIHLAIVWPYVLGAVAVLLLVSGADDLVPLLICGFGSVRLLLRPGAASAVEHQPQVTGERRIAIFVPCWREADVIANMVRHNLAAIRYRSFDFFLGAYPNDAATIREIESLVNEFDNVHLARCRDDGPTSKADCLNWIYERMLQFEAERQIAFDTVVLHDAEDLIHPEALALIDRERHRYEMVQVPVLPLPTGFGDVTHGVYCDEFAEYQIIDMRARHICGAFVPSNGVGTGLARRTLEQLAREKNGKVFDEASLTEDYEIGVRIHLAGYRQAFLPLERTQGGFLATREYFPRSVKAAVRQRTRWVTGIALQCWERLGWRGSLQTKYWYWRDRKGLLANPLSVAANAVFIGEIASAAWSAMTHSPWYFAIRSHTLVLLCAATSALCLLRLLIRGACVLRIYGLAAALAVPLRSFHANLINTLAAVRAVWTYFKARSRKQGLRWQKTEHAYPRREALQVHRRELLEIILGQGLISEEQFAHLTAQLAEGSALDLLLLAQGLLGEEELCKALSLQSGLPTARIDVTAVNRSVARGLPEHIHKKYGTVPFQVSEGRLHLATSRIPDANAAAAIEQFTALPVELKLVTRSTYQSLEELLR